MLETDKRVESWGLKDDCLILDGGGLIVDVGKMTHLTVPNKRGVHISFAGQEQIDDSSRTFRLAEGAMRSICQGVQSYGSLIALGVGCPHVSSCSPEAAAVIGENGSWLAAVRPRRQRP